MSTLEQAHLADVLLERMRADRESDWPTRLMLVINQASDRLTDQERRVLSAASVGLSPKTTAELVGVSLATVHYHFALASARLGTKGITQTVAVAIRKGYI